ncbi:endonuclease I family protein [Actinoplanes regularis]|uniref:endonuclease I family protein n=1 Tax=Actinoplanes regularis TaxID=52697 RepID=UPI0024A52707|nr:endonuclease [Actinoplanes regularis]GLW35320.1 extracellular ribonuclease [Actinoplanes regularis]
MSGPTTRRLLATAALTSLLAVGVPQSPAAAADYYAGTSGKSGAALKKALHDIIAAHVTMLSYRQVWAALKEADRDPANPQNVITLYTGASMPWALHGGGGNEWNREHVWPKSHGDFGIAHGAGTDLHNLRPEKVSLSSGPSGKDFDDGGTASRTAPGNHTDSDSWEPRDAVKGDVARTIFYMAVRYEGGDGGPDLEVDDAASRDNRPRIGRLSALLRWNAEDPPDHFEQNRNEVIFQHFQHNRNPFIDHPEWVDSIFGTARR